ncbi:hypothetical protein MRB53_031116 [Persea americana]|uniref:Uncharacterized protein n=1 Tax=Persea americana TaxID=3435 RepID=A0ACC2KN90_PERAE|nr:hypothetical protein MRB53_031116 [Persea americana]
MFLNFISLVRLQVRKGQRVSSYITFMDLLIRPADDVKLLRDYGATPSLATCRGNSVLLLWILRQQTIGIRRCKSGSSVSSASNFGLLLQETNPWPSRDQNPNLLSLLRSSLQKSNPCGPPRSRNPDFLRSVVSSRWSNHAIAKFFNELARNPMVQQDDSLGEVRMALNPWTVMGLVAGIIILALTAVQTYYAVLQYYDNNRSPPLHRRRKKKMRSP